MKLKKILLTFSLFTLYIGALALFLQVSSQNIALGVLSFITVFIICLIAGRVLIKSTIPSLRKFTPFFYSLSLIVGIVFVSGFTVMAAQNFLSLKKAEKLIHNINQFKHQSGHFPLSLDELKPDYYSQLPTAITGISGKDFVYIAEIDNKPSSETQVNIIKEPSSFLLLYKSSFGVEYSYLSHDNRWESSSDYEFDKIRQIDISEPLTGFFVSPKFTKDHNKK